jgi:hypothetical protein
VGRLRGRVERRREQRRELKELGHVAWARVEEAAEEQRADAGQHRGREGRCRVRAEVLREAFQQEAAAGPQRRLGAQDAARRAEVLQDGANERRVVADVLPVPVCELEVEHGDGPVGMRDDVGVVQRREQRGKRALRHEALVALGAEPFAEMVRQAQNGFGARDGQLGERAGAQRRSDDGADQVESHVGAHFHDFHEEATHAPPVHLFFGVVVVEVEPVRVVQLFDHRGQQPGQQVGRDEGRHGSPLGAGERSASPPRAVVLPLHRVQEAQDQGQHRAAHVRLAVPQKTKQRQLVQQRCRCRCCCRRCCCCCRLAAATPSSNRLGLRRVVHAQQVQPRRVDDFGRGLAHVVVVAVSYCLDELVHAEVGQEPHFLPVGHALVHDLEHARERGFGEGRPPQAIVQQRKHRVRHHARRVDPADVALKGSEGQVGERGGVFGAVPPHHLAQARHHLEDGARGPHAVFDGRVVGDLRRCAVHVKRHDFVVHGLKDAHQQLLDEQMAIRTE